MTEGVHIAKLAMAGENANDDLAGCRARTSKAKVMPKGRKTKVGGCRPPKSGMPYLVVTVSTDGVTAVAVDSKHEARVLASKKTQMTSESEE